MLIRINKLLEKMIPYITPTSVILGVLFSAYLKEFSYLVPWLFAFMTFESSLSMNFQSLRDAVTHPFPVFITLIFLHVVMPIWAFGIGHLVFTGDTYTMTGILLSMIIPTGVTSFIWVAINKGNNALTLAIILIDSLLSPIIVPLTLSFVIGQAIEIDMYSMFKGLIYMIVLPSILGTLLHNLTNGKVTKVWKPMLAPFSKLFLGLVVMLNGAVVAPYLKELHLKLILIIFVVLFIAISGYLFTFVLGKLLRFDQKTIISFTFSGGMRNTSAGTVIAIAYFPSAVIIPVVVAVLFQQTLASVYSSILNKYLLKEEKHKVSVLN